jgi:hypothetical protein
MSLRLNDLMGANPLLGPLEGVGQKFSTFLVPNGTHFARCHYRTQKSLDFQGPLVPMAPEIGFYPFKIVSLHAILTAY